MGSTNTAGTRTDAQKRMSFAQFGSEYNLFRLMMKGTGLSKVDTSRLWATVKNGDYDGEMGKAGEGRKFSEVLSDLQLSEDNNAVNYSNKKDFINALKQSEKYGLITDYLSKDWKATGKFESMAADVRAGEYKA